MQKKTGPNLQWSKDLLDGLRYMSDAWDDHCGFGVTGSIRGRAVGWPGFPVPLNHSCGVPIAIELGHISCMHVK